MYAGTLAVPLEGLATVSRAVVALSSPDLLSHAGARSAPFCAVDNIAFGDSAAAVVLVEVLRAHLAECCGNRHRKEFDKLDRRVGLLRKKWWWTRAKRGFLQNAKVMRNFDFEAVALQADGLRIVAMMI